MTSQVVRGEDKDRECAVMALGRSRIEDVGRRERKITQKKASLVSPWQYTEI